MANSCLFCGASGAGVLSNEHIIPKWLLEHLGLPADKLFQGVAHAPIWLALCFSLSCFQPHHDLCELVLSPAGPITGLSFLVGHRDDHDFNLADSVIDVEGKSLQK